MNFNRICRLAAICIGLMLFSAEPVLAAFNQGGFVPLINSRQVLAGGANRYYQVQKGDTLWSIAKSFNSDLLTLSVINDLSPDYVLQVGQNLQIPQNGSFVHTIKKGETFWEIARHYNITVAQLEAANRNQKAKSLKIGEQLLIPRMTAQLASSRMEKEPSRGVSRESFSWPLVGEITSPFGWRQSGFHHGLDIAGQSGDPIKACATGTVSFVGYRSVYGLAVIIDHPDGKQTLYAHTSKTYVNKGDKVVQGQVIAEVGATGRATGPHLHLEVRINDQAYDPIKYLR